jgi:hypothetical protein
MSPRSRRAAPGRSANNEPFLDIERQPAAQLAQTMAALKRGEVIVDARRGYDGSSNEIRSTAGS